jgi:hypothetical protein
VIIDKRYRKDNYKPRSEISSRKDLFDEINAYIVAHGGFVVSIPGAADVTFEVLEDSLLPWNLIELGYSVVAADPPEGQRLLATPITERLTLTSSGAFQPLTDGSTEAVVEIRTHVGIVRVMRYRFTI